MTRQLEYAGPNQAGNKLESTMPMLIEDDIHG